MEDIKPPAGSVETTVPGGRYAVFSVRSGKLRETLDQIYLSWLPSSGYELGGSPVIEKYGADWRDAKDALMEIWLPIRGGCMMRKRSEFILLYSDFSSSG
jgi:predicted transcriptional regulator YdeE